MVAGAGHWRQPPGHDPAIQKIMNLAFRCGGARGLATIAGVSSAAPYPDRPPFRTHEIDVSGGHRLFVREWGAPAGEPALLLHGGPGSGCAPLLWRFFDPDRYRVIAPDQRGAGASRPAGGVANNTTDDLLADLRLLRAHLGIDRWLVVGGSWGATLALAHVADAPDAARGLLLRAVFLARREDIAAFFDSPPPGLLDPWQRFADAVAPAPGQTLLAALHAGLAAGDDATRQRLALAWWRWETALSGAPAPPSEPHGEALVAQVNRLRVQSHYLAAGCGFDAVPLLGRCAAVAAARIPVLLLHGTADLICPPQGARLVHARLPGSRLQWIEGAGHSPADPAATAATVRALDHWAAQGGWPGEATVVPGAARAAGAAR
jgi:proline iminopeptidase